MKAHPLAVLLLLLFSVPSSARADTVFNVTTYGAVGNGVADDRPAIQQTIDAAIKYEEANNHSAVTVVLPAGTYLLGSGPLTIQKSHNLTFTGAGVGSTTLWYTRKDARCFTVWYNTNVTVGNFTADVQKLSTTGQYDLGETQGTVTAIDRVTHKAQVSVEDGYPSLDRQDIQNAPTDNGWSKPFYVYPDTTRVDLDAPSNITNVAPSPDGRTGVISLDRIAGDMYVGEKWMIWIGPGGIFLDAGYGDYGNTLFQNIDFYGGALHEGMGDAGGTGTFTLNNIYCGPPPYQSDRLLTCDEGWGAVSGRAAFTFSNSKFIRTWDDVFDCHDGDTTAVSQPSPNQVLARGYGDFQDGDTIELIDNSTQPTGSYCRCAVTAVMGTSGNTLLTLSQNVTLHNPGKDRLNDVSQEGPIVATNDLFNSCYWRHVYFFSGTSVTIKGCTFLDDTPLECAGWDGGEGPSDAHDVTISGNTFLNSAGIYIAANGGNDTAPCGSDVVISGNRFLNCGRYGYNSIDSQPINVSNVTGVDVSNNYFENNWGCNVQLHHDQNVTVSNNTFAWPNQVLGGDPLDTSVMALSDIRGGAISGNIVYGSGPYTYSLIRAADDVTGLSGLVNGVLDIDGPLSLYLKYDHMVLATNATAVRQAPWSGPKQTWIAQIAPTYVGSFTLASAANGKLMSNGNSLTRRAPIGIYPPAYISNNPSPAQLWSLSAINQMDSNIINRLSGLAVHISADSSTAGAAAIEWKPGSSECQALRLVAPPHVHVAEQLGLVTLSWPASPSVSDYTVSRSPTIDGPYSVLASGLATGPYRDLTAPIAEPSYYVVSSDGLPTGNSKSSPVWAIPDADYVPVDLDDVFNVEAIMPEGWTYTGGAFSGGKALSSASVGRNISWNNKIFSVGLAGAPDVVSDDGQRIILPGGCYSHLLLIADYVGENASANFQPSITYADNSTESLSQIMTNWHLTSAEPGELDAVAVSKLYGADGTFTRSTAYVHGYDIPIDPSKPAAWLTLPVTGSFRILSIDLAGRDLSTLSPGTNLLPGQHLISPDRKYILTQEVNGSLTIYSDDSPSGHGSEVWSSGFTGAIGPCYTSFQDDSNFVTYLGEPPSQKTPVWTSDTYHKSIDTLRLTDTPELQLLSNGNVIWQRP